SVELRYSCAVAPAGTRTDKMTSAAPTQAEFLTLLTIFLPRCRSGPTVVYILVTRIAGLLQILRHCLALLSSRGEAHVEVAHSTLRSLARRYRSVLHETGDDSAQSYRASTAPKPRRRSAARSARQGRDFVTSTATAATSGPAAIHRPCGSGRGKHRM